MTELTCAPPGHRPSRIEIRDGCRADAIAAFGPHDFVVHDARVRDLHPAAIPATVASIAIDGGESAKQFAALERIVRALANANIERSGRLFAIGGGTIGDAAGFAAAIYLRGIELIQVPTTLLAMVDSSVGGKTAINLPEGKNLAGAFWAPTRVFIDPHFLTTLSDDDYRSGLGEILKIAIGLDAPLFEMCEREPDRLLNREPGAVTSAIHAAVAAKVRIVEADFREAGDRKLLNLGHTLGHAIEADSGFQIAHGIAVARGIHFALDLAERLGTLNAADAQRCHALLERFDFEPHALPSRDRLDTYFARDKKRSGDGIDWVLPTGIGTSITRRVDTAMLLT